MLILAIALFALAAVLGLVVALAILRKKETSKSVALAHGAVGVVGLVLLIVHAAKSPHTFLTAAIVLFVIAALGGGVLLLNDLRKKPGPVALLVIHALAAVVAVVLVVWVAIA